MLAVRDRQTKFVNLYKKKLTFIKLNSIVVKNQTINDDL